jgi:exodeoxyribonuclease V alpha subunit
MLESSSPPLATAPAATIELLELLTRRGVLSAIDKHFALTLARLTNEPNAVALAAAFASRAVQNGHVCADLQRLSRAPLLDEHDEPLTGLLPSGASWLAALQRSSAVSSGNEVRPLVLDGAGRLYLWRYWVYQTELAAQLRERTAGVLRVHEPSLSRQVQQLFGNAAADHLQRTAALIALHKRFTLISGGPGTGKTHTVVKLLALLQAQARALELAPLRILLVAPTGKAAARLRESVSANLKLIPDASLVAGIPTEAHTVHRALGYQPRTPTRFRHDRQNPLAVDVLLLDEASMVSLALLAKLVAAVPAQARLILLGDKDQLASIDAGAIFGDIYNPEAEHGYAPDFAERLSKFAGAACPSLRERSSSGIWDSIVHLTESYRYAEDSGIARLARAVNRGDAALALRATAPPAQAKDSQLRFSFAGTGAERDVALISVSEPRGWQRAVAASIEAGYRSYCLERDVHRKLEQLGRFRVLCAHRRGEFGVEALNALVERLLSSRGHLSPDRQWYEGRPILITQNDYQLELFNGDVGVIASENGNPPRAYFPRPDGQIRRFVPARLPPHETVFAMTVHKSQGSEFDSVLLILPQQPSPIVTRELVYTAVTRARRRLTLCATPELLTAAIAARVERASGLRDALWS